MHRIVNCVIMILLLVPVVAFAIDKKKQKLIVPGRWREVVRMMPDSSIVSFTDTLFMRFQPKDSFEYRNGRNGFLYYGEYKLSEDSLLDLGTTRYKVLVRKGEQLVLVNAYGIYQLTVDKSDTVAIAVIKKEDTARPVNNIDVMIGKWTVYKRVTDGPGAIDPDDNIRSAYITGPSTDGKQGFIYSGSDPDSRPSWHVTELGGGQSLNCAGRSNRTLKVLRCQDGEMILEENKKKYYFKLSQ